MKKYGWIIGLLVITAVLTAVPMSALAQGCGGQMDHSAMGNMGNMGNQGQMGQGNMGHGYMGGSGQMGPGQMGNCSNPNNPASGQPAGTWVPAPSGQAHGNPNPSGHEHNH